MKSLAPQLRLPQGCPSVFIVKRFFGSCILEAYLDVAASALPHRLESQPIHVLNLRAGDGSLSGPPLG